MIVGSWHWTNCLGGYYGLSFGRAGMPLRGPTQTSAAVLGPWDHGPLILVPQIHWGVISFSDRSDSIFRKHS